MRNLRSDRTIQLVGRFVDTQELCRRAQADESEQRLRILPASEVIESSTRFMFA